MSNKKILLVDDDNDLREALVDTLKPAGYTILEAENGVLGLETALREKPDLILLDFMIPELNGVGMLKKLREDTWGKTVPVILLTSLADVESISSSVETGSTDYLIKTNIKLDEVLKKVKHYLYGYND